MNQQKHSVVVAGVPIFKPFASLNHKKVHRFKGDMLTSDWERNGSLNAYL